MYLFVFVRSGSILKLISAAISQATVCSWISKRPCVSPLLEVSVQKYCKKTNKHILQVSRSLYAVATYCYCTEITLHPIFFYNI